MIQTEISPSGVADPTIRAHPAHALDVSEALNSVMITSPCSSVNAGLQ